MTAPLPAEEGHPGDSDYSRFQSVRTWLSLDDFLAAATLESGVDAIRLPSGDHLDVLVAGEGSPKDTCTPAFFSGAMSSRADRLPPFFSGTNLGKLAGGRYIAFSDPLVAAERDLTLGWYGGRAGDQVQEAISRILELVHRRWGREILLVGGSGGGFAALEQMRRSRVPVSALVWNPQTDVQRYVKSFVETYLASALGLSLRAIRALSPEQRLARAEAAGIALTTVGRPISTVGRGGRLLVLQNATDWHVSAHMGPYVDGSQLKDHGQGLWRHGLEAWLIASMGRGHAVPPRATLEGAFIGMVREGSDPVQVIAEVRSGGLAPVPPEGEIPVDLRGRSDASAASVGPRLTVDSCGVHRLWLHEPELVPFGSTLQYQLEGHVNQTNLSRSGTAWLPKRRSSARVVLRDGLGHVLDETHVPVSSHHDDPSLLLVGSCVSRDLLDYMEPSVALVGYHARQSLISAFAPGRPVSPEIEELASPFQRRMISADARSELPGRVRASASSADLLVWDIVDERLGVFLHADGSVTTDTVEWRALHPDGGTPPGAKRVAFGTDEHKELFSNALQSWRNLLEDTGLLRRTVLLAPRWAQGTTSGAVVPKSFGTTAADGNQAQSEYVAMIREVVGVPVVGQDVETVAGDGHRWGVAPFHFDDETERVLASQVLDQTLRRRTIGGVTRDEKGFALSVAPSGPGGLLAVGEVPPGAKVAFHLVHDGARVDTTSYGTGRSHTFRDCPMGRCVVRMFVLHLDGRRESVTSVSVRVERYG